MGAVRIVTGGSGFFGGILKRTLLDRGHRVVSLDLHDDEDRHPNLESLKVDLRDADAVDAAFRGRRADAVFHCAAALAHDIRDKDFLWRSNVDGTRHVAEAAIRHGVKSLVFTSSNCLWGRDLGHPVTEEEPPEPIELYGRSKWEGEKILAGFRDRLDVKVIRCTTITDAGRLGLLAILFEFIDEGRRVWVVGDGMNRYQFVYAADLADACLKAAEKPGSAVYNVGSDDVLPMREVYERVIAKAGSRSKVASLPKGPALAAMRLCYALGLSPLGPYQYRMIASNFTFDTSKAKRELGWKPTLANEEMLYRAYEFYHRHRAELAARRGGPAHKRPARMGVIRVLKWVS